MESSSPLPERDSTQDLQRKLNVAWRRLQSPLLKSHTRIFPRPFSRREFLVGGIASLAGATIAQAVGVVVVDCGLDVQVRDGRYLTVLLHENGAHYQWLVDAKQYGRDAKISAVGEKCNPRTIELKKANFPGTKFSAGFVADITYRGGKWYIKFSPNVGEPRETALVDWMKGGELVSVLSRDTEVLKGLLALKGDETTVAWQKTLTPRLTATRAPFRFKSGVLNLWVSGLVLEVTPNSYSLPELGGMIGDRAKDGLARIVMKDPLGAENAEVYSQDWGKTNANQSIYGKLTRISSAQIHTFEADSSSGGIVLVEAVGRIEIESADDGPKWAKLRVSRFCLLGELDRLADELTVAAQFSPEPFGIGVNNFAVSLRHTAGGGLLAILGNRFDRKYPLDLTCALTAVHVPIAGASGADFQFQGPPVTIRFGKFDEPAGAEERNARADVTALRSHCLPATNLAVANKSPQLTINKSPRLSVSLHGAWLRLQRNADRFELEYQFPGQILSVDAAGTHLEKPVTVQDSNPQRMIVRFPPQHVFEEARTADPEATWPPGGDSTMARPIYDPAPGTGEAGDWLSRRRASGRSRLVFELPDEKVRPLTIDFLTEWEDLALVVHRRALPANPSLDKQLCAVDRELHNKTPKERDTVVKGLIRDSFGVIPPDQTALEIVTGLVLSPDSSGRFAGNVTPDLRLSLPRDIPRDFSLWKANLKFQRDTVVRAIYANGMADRLFKGSSSMARDPFLSSLSPVARSELALLTSAYGIPALRRLVVDPITGKETDDVKGQVIRPEKSYYLSNDMVGGNYQEGFFQPRAFHEADIDLGTCGATFRLRWEGEPPAAVKGEFFQGLSIENYVHDVDLGWDAYVQITNKGFLVPIGLRAALITVTERQFHPFRGNLDDREPTAYLIRREFIVCRKPVKNFPALNQPYDSRDFHVQNFELLTRVTEDLAQNRGDPLAGGDPKTGAAFWPKRSNGEDIIFRYKLDGDPQPVSSPLAFVFNEEAHNRARIKDLIEAYGNSVPFRKTAIHGGVDRKYSPAGKPGDTSFPTHEWRLGIQGRAIGTDLANDPLGPYTFDALMEGADQPPFYPVCQWAKVTMASVDRMLGSSQGAIIVAYHDNYRRNAFDAVANPSEIYLDVLGPEIKLDFAGQGDSAGGIAKPNATLAAISRRIGLVGGKITQSTTVPAGPSRTATSTATTTETRLGFDLGQAASGGFDPSVFFGDARLLGLIALKDVVRVAAIQAAPQLVQAYQYGTEKVNELATKVPAVAKAISSAIERLIDDANKRLADLFGTAATPTLADFYPDLVERLSAVQATANELSIANLEQGKLVALATELAKRAKNLLTALERVANNPTPAFAGKIMEQVQGFRRQAADALRQFGDNFAGGLWTLAQQKIRAMAYDLIADSAFEAVLGDVESALATNRWEGFPSIAPRKPTPAELEAVFDDLLRHPDAAAARIEATAYYQVYGRSFIRLLNSFADLVAEKKDVLSFAPAALRASILAAIGSVDERIRSIQEALTKIIGKIEEALASGDIDGAITIAASGADAILDSLAVELKIDLDKAATKRDALAKNLEQVYANAALDAECEAKIRGLERELAGATRLENAIRTTKERLQQGLAATKVRVKEAILLELGAARERLRDLRGQVDATSRDLGSRAQELAANAFDHLADSALFAALGAGFRSLTTVVENARTVALEILPPTPELVAKVKELMESLDRIELSGAPDDERLRQVFSLVATIRQRLSRGLEWLVEMEKTRQVLAKKNPPWDKVEDQLDLAGRAVELRRRVIEEIRHTCVGLAQLIQDPGVGSFAVKADSQKVEGMQDVAKEVLRKLTAIFGTLTSFEGIMNPTSAAGVRWAKAVKALPSNLQVIQQELKVLTDRATRIAKLWPAVNSPEEFKVEIWETIGHELGLLVTENERALVARVLQTGRLAARRVLPMANSTFDLLWEVVVKLKMVHDQVDETFGKFIGAITINLSTTDPAGTLAAVVGKFGLDTLKEARKTIQVDQAALKVMVDTSLKVCRERLDKAKTNTNDTLDDFAKVSEPFRSELDVIRKRWKENGPGLQVALKLLVRFVDQLVHGQLGAIFDPDLVRKELRDAIESLVPTKVDLNYAWETGLGSFPQSDPIFQINRAIPPGSEGYITPKGKDGSHPDMTLVARVQVDLRNGTRTASTLGEIRPFNIRLLGSALDLVTIKFKGARFEAGPGKPAALIAEIDEVEIGSGLEFIKALQSLMSPGDGDGPYIAPHFFPPAIEAGYRYSAPVIPVGTLLFINVSISVSMLLPFDNRQAEFRFAFASKERPFLISQPPYGGGGHVALRASVKGITAFELSFFAGAVVPVKFGPLDAVGRVGMQIYILNSPAETILEGGVIAAAEGHIACFGVSVCIEVKVRQRNGGDMIGSSTYSMSFDLGLASVSYSFTAAYTIAGGSGNKSEDEGKRMVKNLEDEALWISAQKVATTARLASPAGLVRTRTTRQAHLIRNVPKKHRHWKAYRKLVAI